MATVFKTNAAADDLLEIWLFIADDSVRSADKWIDTLNMKCKQLAVNPYLGRLRKELSADLRSFPVEKYVLFYKPIEEGILLVRVLHGSRDIGFLHFQD